MSMKEESLNGIWRVENEDVLVRIVDSKSKVYKGVATRVCLYETVSGDIGRAIMHGHRHLDSVMPKRRFRLKIDYLISPEMGVSVVHGMTEARLREVVIGQSTGLGTSVFGGEYMTYRGKPLTPASMEKLQREMPDLFLEEGD